jgi:hypothetical protein
MSERHEIAETSPYWPAFKTWVCATCLDRRDDGECGLPHSRVCALKRHLPLIVDVAHRTRSRSLAVYLQAIERDVCGGCPEQNAAGHCAFRDHAECALHAYLSLVLDAIDDVDGTTSSPSEETGGPSAPTARP